MNGRREAAARLMGAALPLSVASPGFAQRLGQGTGAEVPIWRVLGALALCLALAVTAAYVLRRRLGGAIPAAVGRSRRLQLVERLRLSHQTDICLISCDGAEFLVAATPQGAATISATLPASVAPPPTAVDPR